MADTLSTRNKPEDAIRYYQAALAACLAARGRALDADPAATRDPLAQRLSLWRAELDLAGVREPAELSELPADERTDCVAFWGEVAAMLDRAAGDR